METQVFPYTLESKRPSEQLLERYNNASNHFRKVMQGLNDRLALKRGSEWKYYSRGRMALALELEIPGMFEIEGMGSIGDERPALKFGLFLVLKADIKGSKLHYREDKLMLVHDVEVVKGAKGPVPTLIGLYVIGYKLHKFPSSLIFECRISHHPCKYLTAFDDWKLCVLRKAPAEKNYSLTKKNIETASEIMNSVPKNQGCPINRRFALVDFNAEIVAPQVFFNAYGVEVNIAECCDSVLKIRDVLVGPFNLFPA